MASQPNDRPALPLAANLEYLKNQAKARLRDMRVQAPETRLSAAQLEIARELGFKSWRALKAAVEAATPREAPDPFAGYYRVDPDVVGYSVAQFVQADGHYFAVSGNGRRTPLEPLGPATFCVTGSEREFRFEGPASKPAERVLIGDNGGWMTAVRTDAADFERSEAAIARALADQARPRIQVTIDPNLLDAYVGVYRSKTNQVIEVTRRGDALRARLGGQPDLPIVPEGPHRFFYPMVPCQISFRMRGKRADALRIHQGGQEVTFERSTPAAVAEKVGEVERRRLEQERPRTAISVDEAMLRRYPGRYELTRTVSLAVTLEDGRLFGQMTNQRRFEMFAESETSFFLTIVACQINFIADEQGRIDRAVLHQHGRELLLMRDMNEGEAP